MLKKFIQILLLLSVAALIGCGGETNSDEKLTNQLPEVQSSEYQNTPFTEVDAQAIGVMLDQSFLEVKKVLNAPLDVRKEESEAVGFQLIASYDFGELTFDALDKVEGNSTLSVIIINQPGYVGPRGIQVGNSVDEVLVKFPRKDNPVVEGVKELYNLQDGELTAYITYDEKKKITSVEYSKGFGGFGTFSLVLTVENKAVTQMIISVMNV